MLKELFTRNRSYRRFYQDVTISMTDLEDMIDNARLSASGANMQPLKYVLINDVEMCGKVFPLLAWAGYLKVWTGPEEGERPSAYIVQLHDISVAAGYFCDNGIAAQSIMLTAVDKGFGGCIIASVKREALSEVLGISPQMNILHVIALGKPKENVVIEEVKDGDIRYWRDDEGGHHVPKRSLDEMIVGRG